MGATGERRGREEQAGEKGGACGVEENPAHGGDLRGSGDDSGEAGAPLGGELRVGEGEWRGVGGEWARAQAGERLARCITQVVGPALVVLAVEPRTPPPQAARALSSLLLLYVCTRLRAGGGVSGIGQAGALRGILEVVVRHVYLGVLLEPSLYSEETREVVLRALADLCAVKPFLADLYANFDCSLSAQNLFEKLVQIVCKLSWSVSGVLLLPHRLAYQALLSMLHAMALHMQPTSAHPAALPPSGLKAVHTSVWREGGVATARDCIIGVAVKLGEARGEDAAGAKAGLLSERKLCKRLLTAACDAFNRQPKARKALEVLRDRRVISSPPDDGAEPLAAVPGGGGGAPGDAVVSPWGGAHEDLARFFRLGVHLGLDKAKVGEFLGEKVAFNLEVLRAYASTFAFENVPLVDALRAFLQGFQLPGESQKIDRITEAFARSYFGQQKDTVFHTWDGVHILTFSIIMLNTDLHSRQIKKRMSLDEFIRNNRGINQDKDRSLFENLPAQMLEDVYRTIAACEIRLNSADLKGAHDVAGRETPEMLAQRRQDHVAAVATAVAAAGESEGSRAGLVGGAAGMCDVGLEGLLYKEMILSVWEPIVAALSVVLQCIVVKPASASPAGAAASALGGAPGEASADAEDAGEVAVVLAGFQECAQMASRVGVPAMLEALCFNLHRHTLLSLADLESGADGDALPAKPERSASERAVAAFGRSRKSQLVLHALVILCTQHGPLLRRGWWCIFECLTSIASVKLITLPSASLPSYSASQDVPAGNRAGAPGPDDDVVGKSRTHKSRTQAAKTAAGGASKAKGSKGGGGWFSPLSLWGGRGKGAGEGEDAGMQAARCALEPIVGDIRVFLAEVRFLPEEALEALVMALLPMTVDDPGGGGSAELAVATGLASGGEECQVTSGWEDEEDEDEDVNVDEDEDKGPCRHGEREESPKKTPSGVWGVGLSEGGGRGVRDRRQVALELILAVAAQNRDRPSAVWPAIFQHAQGMLSSGMPKEPYITCKRATLCRYSAPGYGSLHSLRAQVSLALSANCCS